jgi:hypothetical protein
MSREPCFVRADVTTEAGSYENVSAVNLGDLDRAAKCSQVTVAELERGKPDAFEAPGVRRLVERQVTPALSDEEIGSRRPRGSVEECVETSLSLRTQRDTGHAA